jgi:hypothetical protein
METRRQNKNLMAFDSLITGSFLDFASLWDHWEKEACMELDGLKSIHGNYQPGDEHNVAGHS